MNTMSYKIVVVTPVYEDEAAGEFLNHLGKELDHHCFVVVVDDGSIENPIAKQDLKDAGLNGTILKLCKNVGHQAAITVGLNYVVDNLNYQKVVIMDSDGEDIPSSMKLLVNQLESTGVDVVVAKRKSRVETVKFKIFYAIYRVLFWLLVGRSIKFGNFMALSKNAALRLAVTRETWLHLAGSVLNSRLRIGYCPLDRGMRYSGKSKMNFEGLTLHGLRGIMLFSENVLVRITIFCIFFSTVLLATLGIMVLLKIAGLAIPGWFSTVSGILLLMLFQTGILALLVLIIASNMKGLPTAGFDYRQLIQAIINVNE